MKVVAALDAFKGSLSSVDAGEAVRAGVLAVDPAAQVVVRAVADGGEGTLAALMDAHNIRYVMQGQAFGSMYPGPLSVSLNESILLVAHEDAELARELLEPFIRDGVRP